MGGGTFLDAGNIAPAGGLSPRGRGNQAGASSNSNPSWSIPAWAGEPVGLRLPGRWVEVYPRVGGGTQEKRRAIHQDKGLSPRGRGNRASPGRGSPFSGSIPAWAGEPHRMLTRCMTNAVYPRVGGGTAWNRNSCPLARGLSPRGRGNLLLKLEEGINRRSIPAWAGEPMAVRGCDGGKGVYPRVGGGTLGNL